MEPGQSVDCRLVSLLTGVWAAPGPVIREVDGRDLVGLRGHVPRPGLGLDRGVGFRHDEEGGGHVGDGVSLDGHPVAGSVLQPGDGLDVVLAEKIVPPVGLEGREGVQAPPH